jgi:hypothetical protein
MDRIEFSIVTKRIEWLSAGGESGKRTLLKYIRDEKVPAKMPRSKCRVCKIPLAWGSGTYNFDHKDNNSANISQKNCFLVCRNCHGKATKIRVVREREPWFGSVVGYRVQRLKVGYKKTAKKPARKPAKKTVKKPARKTAKNPARKTARKSVRKTARRER